MDICIVPDTKFEPISLPAHLSPARIYVSSLSNGSHKAMMTGLNQIARLLTSGLCYAETMPWSEVYISHANAARAWLMQNLAVSTGNKYLSALRGVMRACWELEQISTDHYIRVKAVRNIKGRSLAPAEGRMIEVGEFNAIMRACLDSKHKSSGIRDACMIALGMFAGLRSEDIALMQLPDYDREQKILKIVGKGRVTRQVDVTRGLRLALSDWIEYRNLEEDSMFQRVNKGGRVYPAGISPDTVQAVFVKRAEQAGVRNITSHDGRRTFISTLLDNADLSTVQKIVGHASPTTTAGYDRRDRRVRQEAINTLHMEWNSV